MRSSCHGIGAWYVSSADLAPLSSLCMIGLCLSFALIYRQRKQAADMESKKKADEGENAALLEQAREQDHWRRTPVDDTSAPRFAAATHVPWLDHAKLLGMLLVNLNHLAEMFGHTSVVREGNARTGSFAIPPSVILALNELWGRTNMTIFFFCSGLVAREEVTAKSLRIAFTQLLVPCFLVDAWLNFTMRPAQLWFKENWVLGSVEKFNIFLAEELFQNHYWYLPGLFIVRIALVLVCKMTTSKLLIFCAIFSLLPLTVGSNTHPATFPLGETFSYFPIFILGFLANKYDLLNGYIRSVQQRPLLRMLPASIAVSSVLCCFVMKDAPHRLVFRPFCTIVHDGVMGSSPFSLAWLKLWRLIYAFAFTGWLPVHALGWVTKLGSRTLTNYMLYKLPSILVGKVGACYLMNGLGVGAFWVVAYAAMPFITALLCSEVVTFALWPIILPRAWVGPLIGIPGGADQGSSSPYWPMAFVLATITIWYVCNHGPRLEENYWSPNWWGEVPGAGQIVTPCESAPLALPGAQQAALIRRATQPQ